jgi:hypothetical protein
LDKPQECKITGNFNPADYQKGGDIRLKCTRSNGQVFKYFAKYDGAIDAFATSMDGKYLVYDGENKVDMAYFTYAFAGIRT